jgi:hypothetical protein
MNKAKGSAYFAVKGRSDNAKVAPVLVAVVESYDDAMRVSELRNTRAPKGMTYYPTVHHG